MGPRSAAALFLLAAAAGSLLLLAARDAALPAEDAESVRSSGRSAGVGPSAEVGVSGPAALSAEIPPRVIERELRRGDSLDRVLAAAGLAPRARAEAAAALRPALDPASLEAGTRLTLRLDLRGRAEPYLAGLTLPLEFGRELSLVRDAGGGLRARTIEHRLETSLQRGGGRIEISLYQAAREAGLPPSVINRMIHALSFEVDFQREIRRGDGFYALWRTERDVDSGESRPGELLFAGLVLRGKEKAFYHWGGAEGGAPGFFDRHGRSVQRTLMRTPIDGARLTSRYGRRRHPVLGYSRMHRGLDFGAPRGTPVYAAGGGKVLSAGWKGSYGRYIRLRHNGRFETAYAHLSSFARGLHTGARVEQGQVIGYVGASGRVTGPHLHYEVLVEGKQSNPMTVELPATRALAGAELEQFAGVRERIDRELRSADRRRSGCRLR